jgi:prepilin-type N-terminal cleavage/methylation domain-containing protein
MRKFLNRRRQGGFTLIELLIVIAIIGIIAALLIPNFLDALNKAKQKKDMSTMRNEGEAWFSWYTDLFSGAAAAGQQTLVMPPTISHGSLQSQLVPQYLQTLDSLDAWGTSYKFFQEGNLTDVMKTLAGTASIAMAGAGRGGSFDSQVDGGATVDLTTFDPTDYAQDLVWADGQFIRYPKKNLP